MPRVSRSPALLASGIQGTRYCTLKKIIEVRDPRLDGKFPPNGECLAGGVLFLNLAKWRQSGVVSRIERRIEQNTLKKLYSLGSMPPLILAVGDDWERLPSEYVYDGKKTHCCMDFFNKTCILHPAKDRDPTFADIIAQRLRDL